MDNERIYKNKRPGWRALLCLSARLLSSSPSPFSLLLTLFQRDCVHHLAVGVAVCECVCVFVVAVLPAKGGTGPDTWNHLVRISSVGGEECAPR